MKCGRSIKSAFELTKCDLAMSSRIKPAERDHISSKAVIQQKKQLEEVSQREWDENCLKPVVDPVGHLKSHEHFRLVYDQPNSH